MSAALTQRNVLNLLQGLYPAFRETQFETLGLVPPLHLQLITHTHIHNLSEVPELLPGQLVNGAAQICVDSEEEFILAVRERDDCSTIQMLTHTHIHLYIWFTVTLHMLPYLVLPS